MEPRRSWVRRPDRPDRISDGFWLYQGDGSGKDGHGIDRRIGHMQKITGEGRAAKLETGHLRLVLLSLSLGRDHRDKYA